MAFATPKALTLHGGMIDHQSKGNASAVCYIGKMNSMVAGNVDYVAELAQTRVLGTLLDSVRRTWGGDDLLHHHQQGEFHHDVFVRVRARAGAPQLPGEYLVIATNCNGGVKEVLCF